MATCGQECSVVLLMLVVSVTAMPAQEKTIDEIIMAAAESSKDLDLIQVSQDGEVTIRLDGDMDLSPQQWKEFYGREEAEGGARAPLRDPMYLWPNKTLVYELEKGMFNPNEQKIIKSAMEDWERYTCLKFRPATPRDRNRILVKGKGGAVFISQMSHFVAWTRAGENLTSWSNYLGIQHSRLKSKQGLRSTPRFVYRGTVLHEFGHAIGFHHEQNRPDRDDYVTIIMRNIRKDKRHNFKKQSRHVVDSLGVPYDYESIMHYGPRAFAIDDRRYTIKTTDPAFQEKIGKAKSLSFEDIKGANLLYRCSEFCVKRDSDCPGEGFVGKDCKCWCPGDPYELCDESSVDTTDIDEDYEDDTD